MWGTGAPAREVARHRAAAPKGYLLLRHLMSCLDPQPLAFMRHPKVIQLLSRGSFRPTNTGGSTQTAWRSSPRSRRWSKSSGFRVNSGRPLASATAAIIRSTARAPRGLRSAARVAA